MRLPGGAYSPSYLGLRSNSRAGREQHQMDFNDCYIRTGKIIAAYDAKNDLNRNRKYVEYDVEVIHSVGSGGMTQIVYPRCQVASLFGGVADYIRWTPRLDLQDGNSAIGVGSFVLLACLNGQPRYAYIISGLPNPNSNVQESFENNHHFKFEFNGISAKIDDNGNFVLLRRGATDNDGKILDKSDSFAFLSMTNDGLINIGYDVDNVASRITLSKSDDNIIIQAKNDVFVGTANTVHINAQNGLKVNGASQAFVNGTTYRDAESQLNQTLLTAITAAGAALTSAAAALLIPVAGPALASPLIGTAGAALTAAANAYQVFEAGDSLYLSNLNFHDDGPKSPVVAAVPVPVTDVNQDNPGPVPLQDTNYSLKTLPDGTVVAVVQPSPDKTLVNQIIED